MSTSRALLTFLLICVLSSVSAAPAQAWDFQLGMGDQQARMFSDPRFERLGFEHARVVAPYDIVCQPDVQQQYYLDVWLAGAKRAEVRPLVAFSFSLREGQRWKLPSYRRFLSCFRAFHKRYPQVQDFNPWNEANHSAQPTFRHPKKAAGFYNAMRRACPRCNVAAGDLLDWSHFDRWLERYRAHLRGPVRLWSMHNYLDINRRRSWEHSSTRAMLALTRGHLWITETAGVVHSGRYSTYSEQRAAEATRRMFRFGSASSRITRVYAYHWQAGCDPDAWDSAWFRSDGSARPAYRVLVGKVARQLGLGRAATAALNPPIGPETYDACADEEQQLEATEPAPGLGILDGEPAL
jgi:hypothetical protein